MSGDRHIAPLSLKKITSVFLQGRKNSTDFVVELHYVIAIRARSAFADKLFGSKPRHVRFEHRIVQEQRLAPPMLHAH